MLRPTSYFPAGLGSLIWFGAVGEAEHIVRNVQVRRQLEKSIIVKAAASSNKNINCSSTIQDEDFQKLLCHFSYTYYIFNKPLLFPSSPHHKRIYYWYYDSRVRTC